MVWGHGACVSFPQGHLPSPSDHPGGHSEGGQKVVYEKSGLLCHDTNFLQPDPSGSVPSSKQCFLERPSVATRPDPMTHVLPATWILHLFLLRI